MTFIFGRKAVVDHDAVVPASSDYDKVVKVKSVIPGPGGAEIN